MGGIALAGGVIESILAGVKSGQATEAAEKEYNAKNAFLDNTFDKQYYQDWASRADTQELFKKMQENTKAAVTRNNAISAVSGATNEAKLAAQDSLNKSNAEIYSGLASANEQRKDTLFSNYIQNKLGISNPTSSILANASNQYSTGASNLFGTGAKLMAKGIG